MDKDGDPSGGWRFAQCFGDKGEVEEITEADIISTVEFDHTGDYLATGDKGGRVVLFERNDSVSILQPWQRPHSVIQHYHSSRALILTPPYPTRPFFTTAALSEKGMRVQVPHRVPVA